MQGISTQPVVWLNSKSPIWEGSFWENSKKNLKKRSKSFDFFESHYFAYKKLNAAAHAQRLSTNFS